MIIAIILFFVTFRDLAILWNRYRHATFMMAVGMGTIVLGGVVMEVVSYEFLRDDSTPLGYAVEVALEEFLEMLGASVVLYGALLLLNDLKPEMTKEY